MPVAIMRLTIFSGVLTIAALAACTANTTTEDEDLVQASEQNQTSTGPIRVGLFAGGGAQEPYISNTKSVVQADGRFTIKSFTSGSVNFNDFDVVIFPGGLGSTEWATLEWQGQQNLRTFVQGGGGLIGICAGYYLALDNGFITASYAGAWQRGGGWVNVDIPASNGILKTTGSQWIDYLNGPVIWPSPNVTTLATFQSHIGGAETMVGKPAVVAAKYGQGRVVGFSPHPEEGGLGGLLHDALAWAAKKSATPGGSSSGGTSSGNTGGGSVACDSATLGQAVPKNTCVKRVDENAWYRCGGTDAQDWRPINWPTRELCTSCPQWGPQCPY